MNDKLFSELETEFMDGDNIRLHKHIKKNRQAYFDALAKILKEGKGYFRDHIIDEMEYRDLTEEEREDIYYDIGCWLVSLN